MIFGILKDIKEGEYRVIATPVEVRTIVDDGHIVHVQRGAGEKAGFSDAEYERAGALIVESSAEIYEVCDLVAKVKEFEKEEHGYFRKDQILFTCIHPAAHPEQVRALLDSGATAITAEDSHRFGSPNGEAAGKLGAIMGVESLLTIHGGMGKFPSGLTGAPGITAVVIGCGMVGKASLEVLHALGAKVTVLDINRKTLIELEALYHHSITTRLSSKAVLEELLPSTDLVINSLKWPKESSSFLITREMVRSMPKGAAIVDISNDVGCIETFRETTHENPRYIEEGVVHYCVSNIPGAIAQSTSIAYAAGVLPHFRNILNLGLKRALEKDGYLRRSLVTYKGYLTHEETSMMQNIPWIEPERILGLDVSSLDPAPHATTAHSDLKVDEKEVAYATDS